MIGIQGDRLQVEREGKERGGDERKKRRKGKDNGKEKKSKEGSLWRVSCFAVLYKFCISRR